VPEITISAAALKDASLESLKELADAAGVGYAGLDEEELRDRLRFEGSVC
jgi:hypothetical protein